MMKPDSSQWYPVKGQEAMGEIKIQRVPFKSRKKVFTVRIMEHKIMLPREAMEFLSLEILKSHTDTVVGNLL